MYRVENFDDFLSALCDIFKTNDRKLAFYDINDLRNIYEQCFCASEEDLDRAYDEGKEAAEGELYDDGYDEGKSDGINETNDEWEEAIDEMARAMDNEVLFNTLFADVDKLRELNLIDNALVDEDIKKSLSRGHAHWIDASQKAWIGKKCSKCGARIKYSEEKTHQYCHKCGALMDEKYDI